MVFQNSKLSLKLWGESHMPEMGVVLSGVQQDQRIDLERLKEFMKRRKASFNLYSSPRLESDFLDIKSGISSSGKTDGNPIEIVIKNQNVRPMDYEASALVPRPGHVDYPAFYKYGKIPSGGGSFSGRLTAPLVAAGGIAMQILEKNGINIRGFISQIGKVKARSYKDEEVALSDFDTIEDKDFPVFDANDKALMLEEISRAKEQGDSVGGIVEVMAFGVPIGLGAPHFGSVESLISALLFGVPAIKAVEFGSGFDFAEMCGSMANDRYTTVDGRLIFISNNNGGILGGLSSGQPIMLRAAVKPTPSIAAEQDSVNLNTMENVKLQIIGRHDSCIVPRAVVVVEACVALAILELL